METKEPKSVPRALLAVAETLAVLGGVVALSAGLTLPFLPFALTAEFPLMPPAGEGAISREELLERVESLELADRVEIVLQDGSHRLVLHDVVSEETVESAIPRLLAEAGYDAGPVRKLRLPDLERLVETPSGLVPGLGIQAAVFLLLGALLARWRLAPLPPASRSGPLGALLVGGLGGVGAFALSAVVALVLNAVGIPVEEQPWLVRLLEQPDAVILLLPWFVVVLPLAEEVFFRGYVFRFLAERSGFAAGFVVSSAMFAAAHMNLSGFFVYLGVGCTFALVLSRTSNLLAPITAHTVYNGMVLYVGTVVAPHFT